MYAAAHALKSTLLVITHSTEYMPAFKFNFQSFNFLLKSRDLPLPQRHSNRTQLMRSEAVARIANRTVSQQTI